MLDTKIYVGILALITTVSADYHYEYSQGDSTSLGSHDRFRKPWFLEKDINSEPSDVIGVKKIPKEDKSFKKAVSPFYTLTERDSAKYKDIVMKSGLPYCQEIKVRQKEVRDGAGSKIDLKKGSGTCYKCKDPKTGGVYEYCAYNSKNGENSGYSSSGRYRRSNSREDPKESFDVSKEDRSYGKYEKFDNPYRFSDEIFTGATEDIPAKYKKDDENCEKVKRDSMICLVCQDGKTKAKYEQCSYVAQPNEKSYAYSKSSSFGKPRDGNDDGRSEKLKVNDEDRYPENRYESSSYPNDSYKTEENVEEKEASSADCRKVEKDGKTCTVCKDPKTGGNYEKCSYAYQPNDKVYKFSRSKSFGYPSKSNSDKGSKESENLRQESSEDDPNESSDYIKDYRIPEGSSFYEKSVGKGETDRGEAYSYPDYYGTSDEYKSQSEINSEKIDKSNCKVVEKDSMTCKVCKDPKTGDNFEQCSYAYKPKDKVYAYTKGRSFGTQTKDNDQKNEEPSYDVQENVRRIVKAPYSGSDYTSTPKEGFTSGEVSDRLIFEPTNNEEAKSSANDKTDEQKDFFDSLGKKTEIKKFLTEFRKEDRSNCKKIMKDKMTCYRCVDDKGFRKEECMFVADQEPEKDRVAYRELKEFKIDPDTRSSSSILTKLRKKPVEPAILEPMASASEDSHVGTMKTTKSFERSTGDEKLEEVEPYEYVAETKPVYDKILGLTLPAFMVTKSEHEEEFDEIVESSRI